jgi:hypothetical protein
MLAPSTLKVQTSRSSESTNGAGIALSVRRQATDWTAEVMFLCKNKRFSLLHSVQTGSGAHLAS